MIIYSPVNKTENITWVKGLKLDGGNNVDYGELAHGGARIHHYGSNAISRVRLDGAHVETDLWPMDEMYYQFLDVVDYGRYGINVIGREGSGAGTGVVLGGGIDYLFSNGGKAGNQAVYNLEGDLRDFRLNRILENSAIPSGLATPATAIGLVKNNAYGAPYDCFIGPLYAEVAIAVPAIITSDTTSGSGAKMRLTIDKQFQKSTTSQPISASLIPIQLGWWDSVTILPQRRDRSVNTLINFGTGGTYAFVQGVELYQIGGFPPLQMLLNGRYTYRSTMADDTVGQMRIPLSASGIVSVASNFGVTAAAAFNVADNLLVPMTVGTAVNLTTGVLAGTTGTDGKLNISIVSGTMYIENRLGGSYRVTVDAGLG